jgi:hypothetical protein
MIVPEVADVWHLQAAHSQIQAFVLTATVLSRCQNLQGNEQMV